MVCLYLFFLKLIPTAQIKCARYSRTSINDVSVTAFFSPQSPGGTPRAYFMGDFKIPALLFVVLLVLGGRGGRGRRRGKSGFARHRQQNGPAKEAASRSKDVAVRKTYQCHGLGTYNGDASWG